jgi:hypothetical protein
MIRAAVFDLESSLRQCCRNDESAGFDSIGNDGVFGAAKSYDSYEQDRYRSGALDS